MRTRYIFIYVKNKIWMPEIRVKNDIQYGIGFVGPYTLSHFNKNNIDVRHTSFIQGVVQNPAVRVCNV